jgi:hypothetical protein
LFVTRQLSTGRGSTGNGPDWATFRKANAFPPIGRLMILIAREDLVPIIAIGSQGCAGGTMWPALRYSPGTSRDENTEASNGGGSVKGYQMKEEVQGFNLHYCS